MEKRRVDLPLHRVLKIEKKVNDTVLDGALLLGLFVAACAKWWCAQGTSSGPNLPEDIYIGFGVGALAGAGLDSQIYRRSVIFTAGEVRRASRYARPSRCGSASEVARWRKVTNGRTRQLRLGASIVFHGAEEMLEEPLR